MRRQYHPWWSWECYPSGFYGSSPPAGVSPEGALLMYAEFLRDTPRFENALDRVLAEWPNSCEHFLSNASMNRIAWLGQASMCIDTGVPSKFRAGFKLLTHAEQSAANATAAGKLSGWISKRRKAEQATL